MTERAARRVVVVDGSNLATEGRTTPSLRQLDEAVRAYADEDPDAEIVVVVDASFEHRIDPAERPQLEDAELHGELVSPPAGAIGRGDAFVLRIAERTGARVLSNDSFQEFHAQHPWLFDEGRLVGGKPVPGVGWIFTPRLPVRGPRSKAVTGRAKRAAAEELPAPVKAAELAKAAKKAAKRIATQPDGSRPKVGDVWRPSPAAKEKEPARRGAQRGTEGNGRAGGSEAPAAASAAKKAKEKKPQRAGSTPKRAGDRSGPSTKVTGKSRSPAKTETAPASMVATPEAIKRTMMHDPSGDAAELVPGASEAAPKKPAAKKPAAKKTATTKTATTKAEAKTAAKKTAAKKTAAKTAASKPAEVDGDTRAEGAGHSLRHRMERASSPGTSGTGTKELAARKKAPTKKATPKKESPAEEFLGKAKRGRQKAGSGKAVEATKKRDVAPAAGTTKTDAGQRAQTGKRAPGGEQAAGPKKAHGRPAGDPGTGNEAADATGAQRAAASRARGRDDPAVRQAIDAAMAEVVAAPEDASPTGARRSSPGSRGPSRRDGKTTGDPKGAKRRRSRAASPPPAVNEPLAFITFVATYPLYSEVQGEVVSFTSHGAMVDVDLPGGGSLHSYIPLSAMGDPPPTKARQVLARGERRSFVLVGLDPPRRVAELALPGVAATVPAS